MNIYEKLNTARIKFQNSGIKMGGENKFAKYKYYELEDFLPKLTEICAEVGLCNLVTFSDQAVLTVVNTEKVEETLMFTSPMSTADLSGCHEVQNLGAVETYLRRYLYQTAYEIVEGDALDSTQKETGKPAGKIDSKPVVDDAEIRSRALTLLEKSAMPDDLKARWIAKMPTVTMSALDGLFSIFKKEGLTL